MSNAAEQAVIRRIAVTLDVSGFSRPALDTAVRLAAALDAELEGIFVEDINLMRLAGLPFLREFRRWSLAEEALSSERMARELRALARQAEQMLVQAVGETGISWSFRVWRGRAEAESLLTSFDADILSLARAGTAAPLLMHRGYRAQTRPAPYPSPSVSVLFSGSTEGARALATAQHLATALDAPIRVWLPKPDHVEVTELREKADAVLNARAKRVQYMELSDASATALASATKASRSTVLVAAATEPLLQQSGISRCLEALSCPLLLVR